MDLKHQLSESIALFRTVKINSLEDQKVKGSDFAFLIMINNYNDPISAIDICRYFNYSKEYVSKIIKRLLEMKLITRYKNEKDNRQYFLKTTKEGESIVKTYMDKYMETTDYLYSKLGEEKTKALIASLDEATSILREFEKAAKI